MKFLFRTGTFLLNLSACALLSATAAHWTWHDWTRTAVPASPAAERAGRDSTPPSLAALFAPAATTASPALSGGEFTLAGVVIDPLGRSQAVIAPRVGPAIVASEGEEVSSGLTVSRIGPDSVVLDRQGQPLVLSLHLPSTHDRDAADPVGNTTGARGPPDLR